jgi:hypothetical protein
MATMALRKLAGVFREYGLAKGNFYLLHRVIASIGGGLYLYDLVAQPVPSNAWLPPSRGAGITVRQIDDVGPALGRLPLEEGVFAFRKRQGATCFGAFKGSEMVGYLWLCLGRYREDEVDSVFVTPGSWDFDVYVLPEYRGSIVFLKLWDAANDFLRHRSVRWSMSRISALNISSLASHRRLGARRVGRMLFLRFGKLQVAISSISPHLRLSVSDRKAPVYHLPSPDG